jgi:hypothetical protein
VADESEEHTGRVFCVYSKSKFLDFVKAGTIASDDQPGPYKHYGIVCLDHIVDVASVQKPEIRVLRQGLAPGQEK